MRLEELLHPITPAQFFAEYWEKQPLLIRAERSRFSGLFSSKDLGRLLHYLRPSPPEGMKLIKGGQHYSSNWTTPDGAPRLDAVRAAWREGYTIVVNAMDRLWEPLALLASALQEQLHHPVDINLYFTPPATISASPHFDVMDSFILQVEGSKIWEVHEPVIHLPLPNEQAEIAQDHLPPLVLREELREGDLLYLPRGYVHVPKTTITASLHLTVGINVLTWLDLFNAAVSAAAGDERFRRALPPTFLDGPSDMRERFSELLEALPGHLDMDAALSRLAERLIVSTPPPPGDEYQTQEGALTPDTLLVRRERVVCRVLEGPGYAAVQYSGGKILGPAKIGPALHYVAQQRTLRASDLPGALNEQEKVLLARRLVRGGLLEVKEAN